VALLVIVCVQPVRARTLRRDCARHDKPYHQQDGSQHSKADGQDLDLQLSSLAVLCVALCFALQMLFDDGFGFEIER
jgi:hypothetical protein